MYFGFWAEDSLVSKFNFKIMFIYALLKSVGHHELVILQSPLPKFCKVADMLYCFAVQFI